MGSGENETSSPSTVFIKAPRSALPNLTPPNPTFSGNLNPASEVNAGDNEVRLASGLQANQPADHNSRILNSRGFNFQGLSDRKLNLVFLGLPMSPTGTNYHNRVQNDYKAFLSVLSNGPLKERLSSVSLRDYIRLGKYNRLNERSRPILVKFNCIKDVSSILSNCAHLATSSGSRVVIKHDLSKEER